MFKSARSEQVSYDRDLTLAVRCCDAFRCQSDSVSTVAKTRHYSPDRRLLSEFHLSTHAAYNFAQVTASRAAVASLHQ